MAAVYRTRLLTLHESTFSQRTLRQAICSLLFQFATGGTVWRAAADAKVQILSFTRASSPLASGIIYVTNNWQQRSSAFTTGRQGYRPTLRCLRGSIEFAVLLLPAAAVYLRLVSLGRFAGSAFLLSVRPSRPRHTCTRNEPVPYSLRRFTKRLAAPGRSTTTAFPLAPGMWYARTDSSVRQFTRTRNALISHGSQVKTSQVRVSRMILYRRLRGHQCLFPVKGLFRFGFNATIPFTLPYRR